MNACVCPFASQGIWKLICCGEAANKGAETPLTRILTPPSVVGKGTLLALTREAARFVPKTEAIDPGASGRLLKLAPFTVPPVLNTGVPIMSVRALEDPPP